MFLLSNYLSYITRFRLAHNEVIVHTTVMLPLRERSCRSSELRANEQIKSDFNLITTTIK